MNLNGVEYYYIRNNQGDILGLFDKTGTQVVNYVYDTWGKLISIKDQNGTDVTNTTSHVGYKNPYRYRGYRYDVETGLYYLQNRYYNPDWGRFINADGLIGQTGELLGHNLFAYCKNNPVNMKDDSGFRPAFADEAEERDYEAYVHSTSSISEVQKKSEPALVDKVLNTAVAVNGSIYGQVAGGVADNSIGTKIQKEALKNLEAAVHDTSLGTLTFSKYTKVSKLLQIGKIVSKVGVGAIATLSLGLNVWDDFHNYSGEVALKRLKYDLLGAGAGILICGVSAFIPGGFIIGMGLSLIVNHYIDKWKKE